MEKTKVSKHLIEDRSDRAVYIAITIGFGDIVDEFIITDEIGTVCKCVTNTGVIIVKTPDKQKIITMYIARACQIKKLYGDKHIPESILRIATRNEKKKLMEKSETYRMK